LKTTLGAIIIDDDKQIAKKRVQQITKMPEEQIREFVSPAYTANISAIRDIRRQHYEEWILIL
jgi:hypothetical protein